MKYYYYFFGIIFFFSYVLSNISLLHTESAILFLSFFTIFIYAITNRSYKIGYSKERIRWNEIIIFYTALKNWNRLVIRDRSIKILKFLDLAIQIKKYEVMWLKKNINKLEERDIALLHVLTLKRLDILKSYKKVDTKSNPINYFKI